MKNLLKTAVVLLSVAFVATLASASPAKIGTTDDGWVRDPQFVGPDGTVRRAATTDAGQLKVAPQPKATSVILRPDGGPYTLAANTSDCVYLGANASARFSCRTAQCDYRWVTRFPDAGFPMLYPDAGYASPWDNQLPADTPERGDLAGYAWDSMCVFFEGAGTLTPAVAP